LQLYDPVGADWWTELIEWCGFSPELFPTPSDGSEIIGTVTDSAAAATGLEPGTPVVAGTVDGAAAALEAGVIDPGTAAEMTGTSTVLIMPTDRALPNPAFICMPHALPGRVLSLAAMVSTGACLKWFRDELGETERNRAERERTDAYDLLTAIAAESPPGSNRIVFLPYMMGERSPHWHTDARGVYAGLSLASSKGDLLRAILEGTAFALRENTEIARVSGLSIDRIRSVGGGAQSHLWNQIKADILGVPIEIPNASGGAPFGDAVLAGIGCGALNNAEAFIRETVQIHRTFLPDKRLAGGYTERFQQFQRLYRSLKNQFDDAAALGAFPTS